MSKFVREHPTGISIETSSNPKNLTRRITTETGLVLCRCQGTMKDIYACLNNSNVKEGHFTTKALMQHCANLGAKRIDEETLKGT